jgi:G patch domain-containing protein 1
MKMGWKPGQGIGPRLTARQLKLQERKIGRRAAHVGSITQGAYTADDAEDDEMVDDAKDQDGKKHTFAPRDTKLLLFDNKQDRSGLGFTRGGGMNLFETGVNHAATVPDEQNISSGFGLGGHDADEDDIDIYSPGPSSLRGPSGARRTAYDRDEDDEMTDGVVLLGEGAVGSGRIKTGLARTTHDRRSNEKKFNRSTGNPVGGDGRPVIPGFVVDIKVVSHDKW